MVLGGLKPSLLILPLILGFGVADIAAAQATNRPKARLRFEVSFSADRRGQPADGRVFVMLSKDEKEEPRLEISYRVNSQQILGVDVDQLAPSKAAVIDRTTPGFPLESLDQIPAGDYFVQGLLNFYETFHRSDGHVVKLPMDQGEGQHWNRKPGNLYSKPQKIRIDPARNETIRIDLTERIPPFGEPKDTKYIKHIRIRSTLLSDFWGRPMELGSIVLLPEGFDEHPNARYPLVVYQGHFTREWLTPVAFRSEAPTSDLKDYTRTQAEYGYKFYQDWTSGRLPRMIIMTIQHANPYYDDSYAVNSANLGPYGDAIVKELIPEIEKRFRGIGEPWARVLYGGSTGGWEALGQQIFYPDFFNGSWCNCPDPIDFRSYMLVNIYEDKNAFWLEGPIGRAPRPARRELDGHVTSTMEQMTRYELVLGTRGRSADQLDIWQAVFSPVGEDGYPKKIWDERTGVIDHKVAEYWGDHYDLVHIMQRDWKTLGPKLAGKLRIQVGDLDNYYLDNAVRRAEEFLESTTDPFYRGKVEYGRRKPHCYSGDDSVAVSISRLTINQRFLPEMAEHMTKTAPKGADVTSWKY